MRSDVQRSTKYLTYFDRRATSIKLEAIELHMKTQIIDRSVVSIVEQTQDMKMQLRKRVAIGGNNKPSYYSRSSTRWKPFFFNRFRQASLGDCSLGFFVGLYPPQLAACLFLALFWLACQSSPSPTYLVLLRADFFLRIEILYWR